MLLINIEACYQLNCLRIKKSTLCFLFGLTTLLLPALNISAQHLPKIRIDPAQAYGGTVSEYFEKLEYIPLETTKASIFGDVERLIITDSSFIIVDRDTKSVLFFSRDGRFLSRQKCSSDAFPRISYFKDKGIVDIYCVNSLGAIKSDKENKPAVWTFTSTGVQVTDNKIHMGINYKAALMMPLEKDFFLSFRTCALYANENSKDTLVSLADVYRHDTLYKSIVMCNPMDEFAFCTLGGSLSTSNVIDNNEIFVSKQLSHIVYKLNKDTAMKVFQLVLPANRSIPSDIFTYTSRKKLDTIQKMIWQNPNIVTHISNIHFIGNKMFLKLNSFRYPSIESSEAVYQYNLIYDTVTKKIVSLERMSSDSKNHYLPISGRRAVQNGLDYHDGYFFTAISSLQMFNSRASTKGKKPQYPDALQKYFKTQNKKSNPVIVMMSFKE